MVPMDSMSGERERRGGGRERERKREREEGGGMFGKGRAGKRFATRSTETAVLLSVKIISNWLFFSFFFGGGLSWPTECPFLVGLQRLPTYFS